MGIRMRADQRPMMNRSGLKQMRREGRLPGVIFGIEREAAMIELAAKEVKQFLKTGESGVIELDVQGKGTVPVLLEGLQRDPVTKEPVHIDFLKVREDQVVRTYLSLEYIGKPRGTKEGGVVQIQRSSIEIRSLPSRVPSSLAVDISELGIGAVLLAGDLSLPPEVELVSAANELLVSVTK